MAMDGKRSIPRASTKVTTRAIGFFTPCLTREMADYDENFPKKTKLTVRRPGEGFLRTQGLGPC